MPHARQTLGAAGEAAAASYLASRGYRILERNARAGGVELDIVAERRGVVVFVEVKTRRSATCGTAEEAVDARKRARIVRGAVAWLSARAGRTRGVRFDVIRCEPGPGAAFRIAHWPAAFDAGD